MQTRFQVAFVAVVLIVGCAPDDRFGYGHSGHVWGHDIANPRMGVDCGSIDSVSLSHHGTRIDFAVWVDDMAAPYGKLSGDSGGAHYLRKIRTKKGKTIEASVETEDGVTSIKIAGRSFNAADGLLFLIATDDRTSPVLQINVDIDKFRSSVYRNTVNPAEWIREHPDGAKFFHADSDDATE